MTKALVPPGTRPSQRDGNAHSGAAGDHPSVLDDLLGPPALLDGEEPAAYAAFYGRVREHVRPTDIIEEIWVRDIVAREWDVQRYRHWKVRVLKGGISEVLDNMLQRTVPSKQKRVALVHGWQAGDPAVVKKMKALMVKAGVELEVVVAFRFLTRMREFETMERLLLQAEKRRDDVLRDVSRRREILARQIEAATAVEDAEFREVNEAGGGPA